jgi:DNA-binding transcriptional MerR regulator
LITEIRVDYALADLARVTGAKRRSLQLWADAGVIRAEKSTDRGGSGTHRRFSRDEAIIAGIIHAFALHQIAIGELLEIAGVVRTFLKTRIIVFYPPETTTTRLPREITERENVYQEIIESAINGDGDGALVYESWRNANGTHSRRVNIFRTAAAVKFDHLHKEDGFAATIVMRNYLSKIDK